MKILLVKTSSLGDVVHNLPVASDICRAIPGSSIDWVVEESFAPVPRLHEAVVRVVPVAIRRWRRRLFDKATRDEIGAFLRELKACRYDAVIDTQGLLKSALVARAARGRRYGLDWKSSREPLAMFYNRTFEVPWTSHAVERNRALAGLALGYAVAKPVNYGLRVDAGRPDWLPPGPYSILLHSTSGQHKLWSERKWIELGCAMGAAGRHCVLPWHQAQERARSERLVQKIPGALVPPALTLKEAIRLLSGASAVAGLDTGLSHLATALGVPTVGIYCGTEPAATGLYGSACAANVGGVGADPPVQAVMEALERLRR